ncbi:hypothetical protein SVIO_004150 [Streptomyces violaceusniger]|uniref:Uncharacterized protein n=1 Tax=Streptomyces violaceusniger TaxID=68280 RepID=A0A4D4KMF1_STRVO|nr:hypothetical protein SVIO_004150 [Streptomyces violaceusniger]
MSDEDRCGGGRQAVHEGDQRHGPADLGEAGQGPRTAVRDGGQGDAHREEPAVAGALGQREQRRERGNGHTGCVSAMGRVSRNTPSGNLRRKASAAQPSVAGATPRRESSHRFSHTSAAVLRGTPNEFEARADQRLVIHHHYPDHALRLTFVHAVRPMPPRP